MDFPIAHIHQDGVVHGLLSIAISLLAIPSTSIWCFCLFPTYERGADLKWALTRVRIVLRVFVPAVWDRVLFLPAFPAIHFLFSSGRSL